MGVTASSEWGELSVQHLVYESPKEFIVFVDTDIDLDWRVANVYIEANETLYRDSRGVINAAASTETMPCNNLPPSDKLKFKRLVGEALVSALLFDLPRAEQMIAYAREYNLTRNREVSRYWQLRTGGSLVALLIGLGVLAWINRANVIGLMGHSFLMLALAGVAGATGAFFSITSRMTDLGADTGSSQALNIAESVTRILTGGISGFFGVVAVKSGLILSNLTNGATDVWNVLLIGLAAGLSERFVPSIISKLGLPGGAATAAPTDGTTNAAAATASSDGTTASAPDRSNSGQQVDEAPVKPQA